MRIIYTKTASHPDSFVLVDDEDFEKLNAFKWCLSKGDNTFYAVRAKRENGKHSLVLMHREIMNAPSGVEVDHINGCGQDNTKQNLRLCLRSENQKNVSKKFGNFTSKYKGVSLIKPSGKYKAQIKVNNKTIWIGSFKTEDEAAIAYNEAAKKHHGEFASLNQV